MRLYVVLILVLVMSGASASGCIATTGDSGGVTIQIPSDLPEGSTADWGSYYSGEIYTVDRGAKDLYILAWEDQDYWGDSGNPLRRWIAAYDVATQAEVWKWHPPLTDGDYYLDDVRYLHSLHNGIFYTLIGYSKGFGDNKIVAYKFDSQTGSIIWGPVQVGGTTVLLGHIHENTNGDAYVVYRDAYSLEEGEEDVWKHTILDGSDGSTLVSPVSHIPAPDNYRNASIINPTGTTVFHSHWTNWPYTYTIHTFDATTCLKNATEFDGQYWNTMVSTHGHVFDDRVDIWLKDESGVEQWRITIADIGPVPSGDKIDPQLFWWGWTGDYLYYLVYDDDWYWKNNYLKVDGRDGSWELVLGIDQWLEGDYDEATGDQGYGENARAGVYDFDGVLVGPVTTYGPGWNGVPHPNDDSLWWSNENTLLHFQGLPGDAIVISGTAG